MSVAPNRRSPVRVWADLARAGNFPSVLSNVLAALVLSAVPPGGWPELGLWAWVSLAGLLAYAGGATLNDVADARFDARHRPERVIPSGAVRRGSAAALGAGQLALGGALLLWLRAAWPFVLALLAVVLAYDLFHKRWKGSVLLMGACRLLLAGAIASRPGHAWTVPFVLWIVTLFTYIVALSWLARKEYDDAAAGARIGRTVGQLLALIPCVDALALVLVGAWPAALACAAAYPLGRWAQRLAAST